MLLLFNLKGDLKLFRFVFKTFQAVIGFFKLPLKIVIIIYLAAKFTIDGLNE